MYRVGTESLTLEMDECIDALTADIWMWKVGVIEAMPLEGAIVSSLQVLIHFTSPFELQTLVV